MTNNQSEESPLNAQQLEILMSNYNNLHQSIWDAHQAAWQATQIFMTVISAGIVILLEPKLKDNFTILIVSMATELLVIVWWLFMRMFKGYNDARTIRLKDIERIINKEIKQQPNSLLEKKWLLQYLPQEQGGLEYKKPFYKLQFSPTKIYNFIFAAYNSILLVIVLHQFQKDINNVLEFVLVWFTIFFIIIFVGLLLYEHWLEQCNKRQEYRRQLL